MPRPSSAPRRSRANGVLILAVLFLTGFIGLAVEVAWIRLAALAFGSASLALSSVVAVYFGGLALGSWFFGRRARSHPRPLALWGRAEVALGAMLLLAPAAFRFGEGLWGLAFPLVGEVNALRALVRLGLLALLVLPPTFAMGAALPLVTRHWVVREDRVAAGVGGLYGWNTLGAVCGALAGGLVLLPRIGVRATLLGAGAASLATGFALLRVARGNPVLEGDTAEGRDPRASSPAPWVGALFLIAGAVALANEVLFARFIALLVRNTAHTWALTLAVVLLGIAIGAALAARLFDTSRDRALAFGALQVAASLTVLAVLHLPPGVWETLMGGFPGGAELGALAGTLLVPSILSGMGLPLAVRMVVDRASGTAPAMGRMMALNTGGGILGSLATGFLLLPHLGFEGALRATTALGLAAGLAAWGLGARPRWRVWGPWAVGALVVGAGLPRWVGTRLPEDFLVRAGGELVDVREGTTGNLAVLRRGTVTVLEIDRLWQGEDRKNHQIMAAHLAMLHHPAPRTVGVIGLGTGQTAGRFLLWDIERLDAIDIEPGLVDLVREHFPSAWMDDPRTRLRIGDGRDLLLHGEDTYDVLSIEVGQTFRPGVGAFYTREFYRGARAHLNPGGLLCQFVPIEFFGPRELSGVVRTFLQVFPRSALWYNTGEFLLLGGLGRDPQLLPERWRLVRDTPALAEDLRWAYWGGPRESLSDPSVLAGGFLMGAEGLRRLARGGPSYTDDRPALDAAVAALAARGGDVRTLALLGEALDPPVALGPFAATLDLERVRAVRDANLANLAAAPLGREADRLRRSGNLDSAARLLEAAIRGNPRNVRFRRLLADVERDRGRPAVALAQLRAAVEIDPGDLEAQRRLARAARAAGQPEEALRAWRAVLEARPQDPEARLGLGRLLGELGRDAEALVHLRAAWAAAPDRADVGYQLALVLGRRPGTREETQRLYERCVELDPDFAEAHVNLGILLARDSATREAAIAHYRAAIEANPRLVPAHYNLSLALLAAGRTSEAFEACREALRLDPSLHQAYDQLGSIYTKLGRHAQAVEMYEKALELEPNYGPARENLRRARARLAGTPRSGDGG